MEVRAPFAGEIVERTAVRGALVEAGKSLFTLADRSVMWAMLNISESALAWVRVGQEVELQVDSLPNRKFLGKLTWIGAEVDERSRMARARARRIPEALDDRERRWPGGLVDQDEPGRAKAARRHRRTPRG